MEFKDRIKELRLRRNMSQTELAAKFSKSESAVRMWEVGKSKPDADTLIQLSKMFNCTTDYLLGISNIKNEETKEKDGEFSETLIGMMQSISNEELRDVLMNALAKLTLLYFLTNKFSDCFGSKYPTEIEMLNSAIMLSTVTIPDGLFDAATFITDMLAKKEMQENPKIEKEYRKILNCRKNSLQGLNVSYDAVDEIIQRYYPELFEDDNAEDKIERIKELKERIINKDGD